MKLYLDDDTVHAVLVRILRADEHDVQLPSEVGLAGMSDALHLAHAIRTGRILISHNHKDFAELHQLVQDAKGHHPGILIVRQDNDARRDMTPRGIAVALKKLAASGLSLADQFHVLNHWR